MLTYQELACQSGTVWICMRLDYRKEVVKGGARACLFIYFKGGSAFTTIHKSSINRLISINIMIGHVKGSTGHCCQLVLLLRPRASLPLALTRLVCPKQQAWQNSNKVGCSKSLVPRSSTFLWIGKLQLSCWITSKTTSAKEKHMLSLSWFVKDWEFYCVVVRVV